MILLDNIFFLECTFKQSWHLRKSAFTLLLTPITLFHLHKCLGRRGYGLFWTGPNYTGPTSTWPRNIPYWNSGQNTNMSLSYPTRLPVSLQLELTHAPSSLCKVWNPNKMVNLNKMEIVSDIEKTKPKTQMCRSAWLVSRPGPYACLRLLSSPDA